jgi:hypothetical protein
MGDAMSWIIQLTECKEGNGWRYALLDDALDTVSSQGAFASAEDAFQAARIELIDRLDVRIEIMPATLPAEIVVVL